MNLVNSLQQVYLFKRQFRYCLLFFIIGSGFGCIAQIPTHDLSLWLKGDAGQYVEHGKLWQWCDQSGHEIHATVQTADTPILLFREVNGHSAIRFNGVNTGLATPPMMTFPYKRGTIFVVSRGNGNSKTSGTGYGNLISTYHGRHKDHVWQYGLHPGNYGFYEGISTSLAKTENYKWSITTLLRSEDTIMRFYVNGRCVLEFGVANEQTDTNTLKIGFNGRQNADDIPEVLNGDIAEIIIYGRALSEDELKAVQSYLSAKYLVRLAPPPMTEQWWFYFLLAIAAIGVAVAGTRFTTHRKYRQQLRVLTQEKAVEAERNRISRDLHDDIGSGLTHIAVITEQLKLRCKDDNVLQNEVNKISTSVRKLTDNISEIIWALNPANDELENLLAYIREQVNAFLVPFEIDYRICFSDDIPMVSLSNIERRNIYLTIKEAANNALKHSGCTRLEISAAKDGNKLRFEIRDNGKGLNNASIRISTNGMANMRRRTEEIGGKFNCESGPLGTAIILTFELSQIRVQRVDAPNTTIFTLTSKSTKIKFDR